MNHIRVLVFWRRNTERISTIPGAAIIQMAVPDFPFPHKCWRVSQPFKPAEFYRKGISGSDIGYRCRNIPNVPASQEIGGIGRVSRVAGVLVPKRLKAREKVSYFMRESIVHRRIGDPCGADRDLWNVANAANTNQAEYERRDFRQRAIQWFWHQGNEVLFKMRSSQAGSLANLCRFP